MALVDSRAVNAIGAQLHDPINTGLTRWRMDAAAKIERNPASKHRIQLEYGDEQADAGRDGRNFLARPNSQDANGHRGKLCIFSG